MLGYVPLLHRRDVLGAAGCSLSDEKRGKERNQAAKDKTSFLQDSTQERAAQDRPAPVVRSRSQIYLCTWVPVEYYGTARWLDSAPPEHNVKAFLGTAGRGETWARSKRTEPQMAWDVRRESNSYWAGRKETGNK